MPTIGQHLLADRASVGRDRDDGEADMKGVSVAGFKGKLGKLHPFFRLRGATNG